MSIGIFYGSSTGNTKDVAVKLHEALGGDLHNITDVDAATIAGYDRIVFATSTWGAGDLQDDWEDFLPDLDDVDFSGKRVAILGLGDQENYGDTFVDAMAILVDAVEQQGGTVVGHTSTDGYRYDNSEAERDGKFVGLVIDEDNQSDLTDDRISSWSAQLRAAFS
ncbi:MAG: flavodoxin [Spirochaetaceae bacterium]|nr:MAG: flavodoxin [Spirochaetaceae bacterium]